MVYGDFFLLAGFLFFFFESIVYIPTEAKEFIEKLTLVG